jgi:hypothetical protein
MCFASWAYFGAGVVQAGEVPVLPSLEFQDAQNQLGTEVFWPDLCPFGPLHVANSAGNLLMIMRVIALALLKPLNQAGMRGQQCCWL